MIFGILLGLLPLILLLAAFGDAWTMVSQALLLKKHILTSADKDRIRKHLIQLNYYNILSPEGKNIFLDRVLTFMICKRFIGKQGLEVTEEMKALISASAVQLTFGVKRFKLDNLESIHVFPESFHFGPKRIEHKGATSHGGNMYLSWQDFKEGYLDPGDRYNLGLHEMSHALKLSVITGSSFDAHFGSYLDQWLDIASTEFERMKHGNPSFLRSYAKTNRHEFFAVCVEHFFECPGEFKEALPDVYNHLVILLNQNPLNTDGDYKVDESFIYDANKDINNIPLPKEVRKNLRYNNSHWTINLGFLGMIIGIPLLNQLEKFTVISFEATMIAWAVFTLLSLYIWRNLGAQDMLDFFFYIFYCAFGPGITMAVLFFSINYLIPVSDVATETHLIETVGKRYVKKELISYKLYFSDNVYEDEEGIRTFSAYTAPDDLYKADEIIMDFRYGIFGLRTLRDYRLIDHENE